MQLKTTLTFLLPVYLLSTLSNAQDRKHRCGHDDINRHAITTDAATFDRMQEASRAAKQWVMENEGAAKTNAVITIPVIFHVLYNKSAENVSNAQIMSQLDVLNEDYNRLNKDTTLTPSYFKSIAGKAAIQFCLATRDPQGNPTSGITRTFTNVTAFTPKTNTNIYYSSKGGKDAWPSSQYLNIWVANIDGTLGGAPLPGAPAYLDGLIIGYDNFGRTGAVIFPGNVYNKGRTATHEIGHWLGLAHNFANGNCSDDGIADTPVQAQPTFDCPTGKIISCNNSPNGNNYQNYMDYTDDACMNMITKGQVTKILGTLNTTRKSLLTSPGCGSAVGIDNLKSGAAFSATLYPNPGTGLFYAEIASTPATDVVLEVFNILGTRIKTQTLNGNNGLPQLIDMSHYSDGVYVAKFTSGDMTHTERLIIKR